MCRRHDDLTNDNIGDDLDLEFDDWDDSDIDDDDYDDYLDWDSDFANPFFDADF
jgi:hypothetical protein